MPVFAAVPAMVGKRCPFLGVGSLPLSGRPRPGHASATDARAIGLPRQSSPRAMMPRASWQAGLTGPPMRPTAPSAAADLRPPGCSCVAQGRKPQTPTVAHGRPCAPAGGALSPPSPRRAMGAALAVAGSRRRGAAAREAGAGVPRGLGVSAGPGGRIRLLSRDRAARAR